MKHKRTKPAARPLSAAVIDRVRRDHRIRRAGKRAHALDGTTGLSRFLDLRRS